MRPGAGTPQPCPAHTCLLWKIPESFGTPRQGSPSAHLPRGQGARCEACGRDTGQVPVFLRPRCPPEGIGSQASSTRQPFLGGGLHSRALGSGRRLCPAPCPPSPAADPQACLCQRPGEEAWAPAARLRDTAPKTLTLSALLCHTRARLSGQRRVAGGGVRILRRGNAKPFWLLPWPSNPLPWGSQAPHGEGTQPHGDPRGAEQASCQEPGPTCQLCE